MYKHITLLYIILIIPSACAASGLQATNEGRSANFNGIYSDFGADINMNELYDFIAVNVGIDVLSPGEYVLKGSLYNISGDEIINISNYNISGDEIINISNRTHLDTGVQSIQLKFYGSNASGKRLLKNLTLYDSDGNLVDHIDDAYTTRAKYNNLDHGSTDPAWLTGNYSEHGIDINRDGLYDYLAVDVGTYVQSPGDYNLMGYLYDQDDREVGWTIDFRNISNGYQTMHLNFDGKSIRNQKANGPYSLRNVTLSSGSSYTGLKLCDHIQMAYTISEYSYSDFGN